MGKVRKTRHRPHREGTNESNEEELQIALESGKENAVQTILDQLQGQSVEEKYCGLQTFAMFIDNPDNISEAISSNIIKASAPLLFDGASSVRNAASGALRNLSNISLDVCEAMIEQDIMTPLVAYFHEHTENWTPKPNQNNKMDDDTDTFIQCINLLWNLCESSEIAVKYLNQSRILHIILKCLDFNVYGSSIIIAILQCLFVVTENNLAAIEIVKTEAEEKINNLFQIGGTDSNVLLIKTLAAGIVINICSGNITSLPANTINSIMTILSNALSIDHRIACNKLSSDVPLSQADRSTNSKDCRNNELEKHIESVTHLLDAQQCSIEILANLCSSEDGEDNVDTEYSSDSDEIQDEEIETNDTSLTPIDRLPMEVLESITSFQLLDKVRATTVLPPDNVVMILREYEATRQICNKLQNLQSRSLLCINNMLSTLPIEMLGNMTGIYRMWVDTGKLVFKQTAADNSLLLESATAVMRAALDRLKVKENGGVDSNLFSDLALSDIEMMLNGTKDCQVPEIRANLIRIIGTLALLLTSNLNETSINVVTVITDFILSQAHKETEVWVLAEALDTVMDLYSEDETDLLAANIKLVDKLNVLAPILKNKARQQRKCLGEHSVVVHTATTNLPRFIKYKRGRIAKLI